MSAVTLDEVAEMLRRYNPRRYQASLFRVYEDAQRILGGHTLSTLGYDLPTLAVLMVAAKRPRSA
jgi:hypothetical protein